MTVAVKSPVDASAQTIVDELVRRARAAMAEFANADQARTDEAVTALAWALYNPAHAKELAELAVADTKLGNVPDKIVKKQRKTFGTLRDLLRVKSVGIIEEDAKRGIVKYAKPVGVVCAITPSTNPGATPVNKAMMAIKGRNAIIIAASPAGLKTTTRTVDYMRAELKKIGVPEDLVQILPPPASKDMTQALMQAADLVVATGSQDNVRRAYSSGTPAIGVGTGNVPVIIDETADLDDAARKICASKIFDNATSCSSENSVILVDAIYDQAMAALERAGGYRATPTEKERIQRALWPDGKLSRTLIARDAEVFARGCGLPAAAEQKKFFMVEETGVGRDFPFSSEKLSLVLTIYRAKDFDAAIERANAILRHQGLGHSVGLHTKDMKRGRVLAERSDVVRVLINQAHTFGNGGGFDNGLNFTLSMGCGTWGGNSITDNLNYMNFLNITHLVTTIPEDKPSEEQLFGALLDEIRQVNEFRGTCRESADPGACRHCSAARDPVPERKRSGNGGRADRPLRGQGASADRQTRQGRRHQARQHAHRGRAGRGPNPRHAHRRLYRRAPADRGAGEDRARILRRGAARHAGAQTADLVFHRRRHGYRGDRRRKAASDPPLAGRYRRQALGWRHCRHVEGPRSRRRARRRSPTSWRVCTPPTARATPNCWRSTRWRCWPMAAWWRSIANSCSTMPPSIASRRSPATARPAP